MSSKLDIVVMGATGFTGRLTCRYLARKAELKGLWGIAGRCEAKLASLRAELGCDIPTFVVDIEQPTTLDTVCAQTACLIACAGPFTFVGMTIVDACVRHGTHYVDSTGEVGFVRRLIANYHETAAKSGVAIVPCCAFESVPADLGNYITHRAAGEPLKVVHGYFDVNTAGASNGTINTVANIIGKMSRKEGSPLALVSGSDVQPTGAPTRYGVWYENGRFTGLFFGAYCDEKVVRRTNSLMGSSAVYVEAMQGTLARVLGITVASYAVVLTLLIAPLRQWIMKKFFSSTSVGPSDLAMSTSNFRCDFVGKTVSGKRVETTISAKEDAYTATALFLGECAMSALTLARKGSLKGGVLTPVSAFGDELVERSRAALIHISTCVSSGSGSST